jgi:hypothetical protein
MSSACLARVAALCLSIFPSGLPPRAAAQSSQLQVRKPISRSLYVGDEVCASCHRSSFETFTHTAHHLTSQVAGVHSIAGSFTTGANTLSTSNPGLHFRMDAKSGRFFETALWGIPPDTKPERKPIDVVIGSGRKGQTYLYWKGDRLFQLPVSYWVDLGQWVNSPGYEDGYADFNRPVPPRCLECHGSFAESLPGPPPENHYQRETVILGISCERCHGPGSTHAARHQSASGAVLEEAIVNPGKLSRDREVEVCAQCHAGMRYPIAPAFTYVPGEPLDEYLDPDRSNPDSPVDVHGGQVVLLKRSACYQSSPGMTCSTCHNVHEQQRDASAFSAHCLSCHKLEACGVFRKLGPQISNRCIDCHMPVQESKAIITDSKGRRVSARVRTHWIKVYPNNAL